MKISTFLSKALAWRILLFAVTIIGTGNDIYAQILMRSWGWSAYTDVVFEGSNQTVDNLNGFEDNQKVHFSTFTFNYEFKVNLKRFKEKRALSAVASPSVGLLWIQDAGIYQALCHYRIPFYMQYDIGLGAMRKMKSKRGFGVGAGFHFNKYGLVGDAQGVEYFQPYLAPSLRIAYRYLRLGFITREICLTFDPPVNVAGTAYSREIVNNVEQPEAATNFTRKVGSVRLTIVKYLDFDL